MKQEVQVKIAVKPAGDARKELSQEEKAAEERRLLAESYRKHKIDSHPPEEFWVPVRKCFMSFSSVCMMNEQLYIFFLPVPLTINFLIFLLYHYAPFCQNVSHAGSIAKSSMSEMLFYYFF